MTTAADEYGTGASCSLREAIARAGGLPQGGDCLAASSPPYEIILPSGTYALTLPGTGDETNATGDLDISASVTITSVTGADWTTIEQDASPDDRVLDVHSGTVILNGVTISGGSNVSTGGGIQNTGTLTLNNSAVSQNTAGSGGGISNDTGGNATISASTISNNAANGLGTVNSAQGGGIFNVGTMTITGSQIGSNTSFASVFSGGGGILSYGNLTIQGGSTIGGAGAGNSSGSGGGIWNGGNVTVTGSTVSANLANLTGGGIHNAGTLAVQGGATIASNNSAGSGGGIFTATGRASITDSMLIGNSTPNDGDAVYNNVDASDGVQITGSCIVNNGNAAVFNGQPTVQTATGNWWGSSGGPGPVGSGAGDTVSVNVDYSGFLTADPGGCGSTTREALEAGKTFGASVVPPGGTTTATIHVHNPNTVGFDGIHFTDPLPSGLAAIQPTSGSQCGGTVNIANPAQVVFMNGSLEADDGSAGGADECDIVVTLHSNSSGPATNPAFAIQRNFIPDGFSAPVNINLLTLAPPPLLKTPKNGSLVYKIPVRLGWAKLRGANGYRVLLENVTDPLNPFMVLEQDVPKGTRLAIPALGFGLYHWRAATKNALGPGVYSAPFTFEVTLNKVPKKGAVVKNGQVSFKWQAVRHATYELEVFTIADNPEGSLVFPAISTTRPSYKLLATSALPGGGLTYYWRVSIDGGSTWTLPWGFTVK